MKMTTVVVLSFFSIKLDLIICLNNLLKTAKNKIV